MLYLLLFIGWLAAFHYVFPRDLFWGFVVFLLPASPLYIAAWRARDGLFDFLLSATLYTGLGVMAALFVFFLMGIPEMIRGR